MSNITRCDHCKKEKALNDPMWLKVDFIGHDIRTFGNDQNPYLDYPVHFCSTTCISVFWAIRTTL